MPTFNDPSLTAVWFGKQASEGTQAATLYQLRALPPTLSTQVSSVQSVRPISGRTGARDTIRTSVGGGGDWSFEFGSDEFDLILEAALGAAVVATGITLAVTCTVSTPGTDLVRYTSASSTEFATLAVGDYIRTAVSTSASNNGWFPVVAKESTGEWIEVVNPDGFATGPENLLTFDFDERLVIGGDKPFLTIEIEDRDPTPAILATELYIDQLVATFGMTFAQSALINCTTTFSGKAPTAGVAQQRTGSPGAAFTSRALNSHDDVVSVGWYNGSAGYSFKNKIPQASWTIDNGVGQQLVVGQIGPAAVAQDIPTLSGTVNLLIENDRLLTEILGTANSTSVFGIGCSEGLGTTGNISYGFSLTGAKLIDLGRGQDAQNLPFFRSASLGATGIVITKYSEA